LGVTISIDVVAFVDLAIPVIVHTVAIFGVNAVRLTIVIVIGEVLVDLPISIVVDAVTVFLVDTIRLSIPVDVGHTLVYEAIAVVIDSVAGLLDTWPYVSVAIVAISVVDRDSIPVRVSGQIGHSPCIQLAGISVFRQAERTATNDGKARYS
jgi:hypothetical protein